MTLDIRIVDKTGLLVFCATAVMEWKSIILDPLFQAVGLYVTYECSWSKIGYGATTRID